MVDTLALAAPWPWHRKKVVGTLAPKKSGWHLGPRFSYPRTPMTSAILNLDKLLTSPDSFARVRRQLLDAERAFGVSDLHINTIRILQKRGARLVHAQGHLTEIVALAVSPNGRHLATGGWVGDDYERGGMIQIWDIEMGRCVNVLDPIEGGVGWPEYPNCLSWTADNETLGVAFNTNSVGFFNPFGTSSEALHYADVTDGWSRPPAFCVLPDGKQLFVGCWQNAEVPGTLVAFKEKKASKRPSKKRTPPIIKAMAKKIPEAMREKLEDGHLEPPKQIIASADGTRVFCINSHSRAFAITLATGELDYITKVGLPAAYSPDGRFLAHTLAGLVFYDGNTGLATTNLPMHMGMNSLHWGKRGTSLRLAGVVSAENEFGADPGVHLYDDGTYRYSIDVKPRTPRWDDGDFKAFAWAPSGERAGVLDDEGRLFIVTLGDTVVSERVLPMKEGLRGIWWASPEGSASDFIIVANRTSLVFVDASTGEIVAEHVFMRAPGATRPLDTGVADLADSMRPDPSFAVNEETWAAAFSEGLVIGAPEILDKLDLHLAWAMEGRTAWPVRWGGLHIVGSAAEVAKGLIKPKGVDWRKFKPTKTRKSAMPFPPENPLGMGALYNAVVKSMEELGRGWSGHVAENLWRACIYRARRGEIAEALAMADHIPSYPEMLCAKADLTAIAHRSGHANLLEDTFAFVAAEVESEILPENEILYAISMFSAWAAKKDQSQSDAWLARAKAKLEPENNAWQYRLALVWALFEAGRENDARALFTDKAAWRREPLCFYSIPFAMTLVRERHDDLLFEFLETWKQYRFGNIDWSLRDKLGMALAHFGHFERLVEGKERFGLVTDEERLALAKTRESTGRVLPSPSPADTAILAHDFSELQKTPRARRSGGTRVLIQKAAAMGHVGAVVALLPDLPGTNFNDRPQAALSALWTMTTGFDVVPW